MFLEKSIVFFKLKNILSFIIIGVCLYKTNFILFEWYGGHDVFSPLKS